MELEKLTKLIDQWKGLFGSITILLVTVAGLWTQLLKWNPLTWTWPEFAFALVACLVAAALTIRNRRANASRLIDPEALKLDPRSPEQLIGRREDLDRLLQALANPLVFLVGESGCGKSALLRAAVVQEKSFTDRFLPIYVDMSFLDWEDGPLRAVREEFSRALPNDDPIRARLDAQSGPQSFVEVFGDYYRRTQRRPLLLLDQFDDYQADPRHRDRFLPKDTRVWRAADAVARDNAFWRVLRLCLQSDRVSIIVACREDAAAGLESLRFEQIEPRFFDLPRLERGFVRLIIDRLLDRPPDKGAIIANPQGGWTALLNRLVDDLEARGQILPQQMKVVLGGLRTLHRLTPAAYTRAGRVAGLEASFVSSAIAKAARAATLRDEDALHLISALVDRTRQPPDKAPPRTLTELARIIGATETVTSRALYRLEADEVVHRRGDAEGETSSWQLYHAYLAEPIVHIERERDQWRKLLAERARAYDDATWWDRRWRALLPLRTQARLFVARLRGHFHYGEYRGYALRSLVRGLPVFASIGLLAGLTWFTSEYEKGAQIEAQIFASDDFRLSDDAAIGLADLAASSAVTRWRITRDIFTTPTFAERFFKSPESTLRALLLLDASRLNAVVTTYVTPDSLRQSEPRLRAAVGRLVKATSYLALTDEGKAAFERALKESLSKDSGTVDLFVVADGVRSIASALSNGDERAAQWLVVLRSAVFNFKGSSRPWALSPAYEAMLSKMAAGDPRVESERVALLDAIGKTKDVDQILALMQAYVAVTTKLNNSSSDPDVLGVLHDTIAKSKDFAMLQWLLHPYVALVDRLKDGDPRVMDVLAALRVADIPSFDPRRDWPSVWSQTYASIATRIKVGDPRLGDELAALRDFIHGNTRIIFQGYESWARTYMAMATKLKNEDANTPNELAALREAIRIAKSPYPLSNLATTYGAVATKLKDGDPNAVDVLAALRVAVVETGSPQELSLLKDAYATVATNLKKGDLRILDELGALRAAIIATPDPDRLSTLGSSYAVAVKKLIDDDPHLAGELAALRAAIGTPKYPHQLSALAMSYAAVVSKLKDGDPEAKDILLTLRGAVDKVTDPEVLARAHVAVASKVTDGALQNAYLFAALRQAIGKAEHSQHSTILAMAYALVAAEIRRGDPQAIDVLAKLRAAIPEQYVGLEIVPTGYIKVEEAYEAVAATLKEGDPHAADELGTLRDAIAKTDSSAMLGSLAKCYAAVARAAQTGPRDRDVAVLLARVPSLRTENDSKAFADALKEAAQRANPSFSREQVGLIYAAALLAPTFAGEPSRQLIADYEQITQRQQSSSWSGDVWSFAIWAKDNLPGFHALRPKVGFLPSVSVAAPARAPVPLDLDDP